jgi:hypothetical protein
VTFAEECQRANKTQDEIFVIAQEYRREEKTGIEDLFSMENHKALEADEPVTTPWLDHLKKAGDQLIVDTKVWAMLLEEGRCLPGPLQLGLKKLMDEGVLRNDAAKNRRKHFVHFEKAEVVQRIK